MIFHAFANSVVSQHTPVDAGQDRFDYELVERILGDFIDLPTLKHIAGDDGLNMTRLALNLSEYVNGVRQATCGDLTASVSGVSCSCHYQWCAPFHLGHACLRSPIQPGPAGLVS